MTRWYVAYTRPQAELKAAQHLRNQQFTVFLPMCRRQRRHAGRVETVLRPLFPRYLFVWLDLDRHRWRSVNGTRGVLNIVSDGDQPLAVPAGVVEDLQRSALDAGFVPLDALASLERGQPLLVTAGPFAGQTGRYESLTDDQRLVLLLNLLGRSIRLAVPLVDVDAA
jgi:transcriptional antiterminator RfaH